jgi:tetratricopeptide (TPR) repeat protein
MEASGMFNTVKVNKNVGNVLDDMGKYEEALVQHQKSLDIKIQVVAPPGGRSDHPSVADSFNNVACTYEAQGKYQEALGMHTKSLEIRTRIYGTTATRLWRGSHVNTWNVLQSMGK